jgi:hypothetical protein
MSLDIALWLFTDSHLGLLEALALSNLEDSALAELSSAVDAFRWVPR